MQRDRAFYRGLGGKALCFAIISVFSSVAHGELGKWVSYTSGRDSEIVTVQSRDNHPEQFQLDKDGNLYHQWKNGDGSLSGWVKLGDNTKGFTVGKNRDGRLEVFATDWEDKPYHIWNDSNGEGGWSPWAGLGDSRLTQMTVARNKSGKLEVFGLKSDGSVAHVWQGDRGWQPDGEWMTIQGSRGLSGPLHASINWDYGRLRVSAMDHGHKVYSEIGGNGVWPSFRRPLSLNPADYASSKLPPETVSPAGAEADHHWVQEHSLNISKAQEEANAQSMHPTALDDFGLAAIKFLRSQAIVQQAMTLSEHGTGVEQSMSVSGGVTGGVAFQAMRFGDQIHFFCGPAAGVAADASVGAAISAVKTTRCNAPQDFKGGFINVGFNGTFPLVEVGATKAWSLGVDNEKFVPFMKNDVIPAFRKLRNTPTATINAAMASVLASLRTGTTAPAVGFGRTTALGVIQALLTLGRGSARGAINLAQSSQVRDYVRQGFAQGGLASSGVMPDTKKILGEDIAKAFDAAAAKASTPAEKKFSQTIAALCRKMADVLSGCDATSKGVTAGIGVNPAVPSLTYSNSVHLDGIRASVLVPKGPALALALVSLPLAVAAGNDVPTAQEARTMRKVAGLIAGAPSLYNLNKHCVQPGKGPICDIRHALADNDAVSAAALQIFSPGSGLICPDP